MLSLVDKWPSSSVITLYKAVCERWLQNKIDSDVSLIHALPRVIESQDASAAPVTCRVLGLWFDATLRQHEEAFGSPQAARSRWISTADEDELGDEGAEVMLGDVVEALSFAADSSRPLRALSDDNSKYILQHTVEKAAVGAPEAFLQMMVSLAQSLVRWTRSSPRFGFPHDPLFLVSRHSISGHTFRSVECLLWDSTRAACEALADRPQALRPFVDSLRPLLFKTPQAMVAVALRSAPKYFALEAADFLLEDARRLWLGFAAQADSALLLAEIFPLVDDAKRRQLEAAIAKFDVIPVSHNSSNEDADLLDRERGQLRLLSDLPRELLGAEASKLSHDLESRHPKMDGYAPAPDGVASLAIASWQASPADDETAARLSDDDWTRLIAAHTARHRQGRPEDEREAQVLEDALGLPHDSWMVASSFLKPQVVAHPERFARLALERLAPDTHESFAVTIIDGLAESTCEARIVFDVARHFAPLPGAPIIASFWQSVAHVVDLRLDEGVPDEVLALLEEHLLAAPTVSGRLRRALPAARRRRILPSDPFAPAREAEAEPEEDEPEFDFVTWINAGSHADYLNNWPERDVFVALLNGLNANEKKFEPADSAQAQAYQERRWNWIAWAATQPSDAVRCGGLIFLRSLFGDDRERAWTLYEALVEQRLDLLAMAESTDVLRYATVWFPDRAWPHIERLLRAERAAFAQRGAELVCVASWHGPCRASTKLSRFCRRAMAPANCSENARRLSLSCSTDSVGPSAVMSNSFMALMFWRCASSTCIRARSDDRYMVFWFSGLPGNQSGSTLHNR